MAPSQEQEERVQCYSSSNSSQAMTFFIIFCLSKIPCSNKRNWMAFPKCNYYKYRISTFEAISAGQIPGRPNLLDAALRGDTTSCSLDERSALIQRFLAIPKYSVIDTVKCIYTFNIFYNTISTAHLGIYNISIHRMKYTMQLVLC